MTSTVSAFSQGTRPVIRWIKGDGLDDVVTRSAIAQATRLFGNSVDYCLCTSGLAPSRVRDVLAWADQPVEWWPVEPADNPELTSVLLAAGCDPDHFGYWWKWFPERVRAAAPEWILDGDMVVVGAPSWFSAWKSGHDPLRMTEDDKSRAEEIYGEYVAQIDLALPLYSGLVSLPPNLRYIDEFLAVLRRQPLLAGHNGRENMSEQGVVAAAFNRLGPLPISLSEFPFGRAFEERLDYGLRDHGNPVWGYHFGYAFRRKNAHFKQLLANGTIYRRKDDPVPQKRFTWMRNFGQWGREGWSMQSVCVDRVAALAKGCAGKPVLEIGTSRGYLAAVMASHGCRVTTVDHEDRGARKNLDGLGVDVVSSEAVAFLAETERDFSLIVVDLHGNDVATWQELWPKLRPRLDRLGTMVLYNSHLWKIPEWHDQTGLLWLAQNGLDGLARQVFEEPPPGMIVCRHE